MAELHSTTRNQRIYIKDSENLTDWPSTSLARSTDVDASLFTTDWIKLTLGTNSDGTATWVVHGPSWTPYVRVFNGMLTFRGLIRPTVAWASGDTIATWDSSRTGLITDKRAWNAEKRIVFTVVKGGSICRIDLRDSSMTIISMGISNPDTTQWISLDTIPPTPVVPPGSAN